MIKDILENLINELHNEKNKEQLYTALEPFSYKLRMSWYLLIIILVVVVANLIYTNLLLSELVGRI